MHVTGAFFILIGGAMEGLFSLPVKLTPKWSWENIWGSGSLAALVLVPASLLFLTIPNFVRVYADAPGWAIILSIAFGAGWGLGGIFFGLGISELGLSLGTSSIMGIIAIGGSVVPLLIQHGKQPFGKGSAALLLGITVMLVGLTICARAGSLKLAGQPPSRANSSNASFARGAFYCVAAGVLSALVNFALIFGAPIAQSAARHGATAASANNATWAIVFASNYIVNVLYCIYLMRKRGTLGLFTRPATAHYWLLAVIMGLLWSGGIVIYGIGASMEGKYGPVFAFPVMLIVSILTANSTGVLLGEWRGVAMGAKHTMQFGVAIMVAAIVVLGYANAWTQ